MCFTVRQVTKTDIVTKEKINRLRKTFDTLFQNKIFAQNKTSIKRCIINEKLKVLT